MQPGVPLAASNLPGAKEATTSSSAWSFAALRAPSSPACPCLALQQATTSTSDNDWELDPHEIVFHEKIASGAFGDLFRGTYCGQDVAIKILRNVHEDSQQFQEFLQVGAGMWGPAAWAAAAVEGPRQGQTTRKCIAGTSRRRPLMLRGLAIIAAAGLTHRKLSASLCFVMAGATGILHHEATVSSPALKQATTTSAALLHAHGARTL